MAELAAARRLPMMAPDARAVRAGGLMAAGPNIAAVGTSSTAPRGVIGGIEGGYNWQVGHFALGFETDFSGWNLSSSAGVVGVGYSEILVPQPSDPCITKLEGKPPNQKCAPW